MNNYDPSQPRHPRGSSDGGRWIATQPGLFESAMREGAGLNTYKEKVGTIEDVYNRGNETTVWRVNKFENGALPPGEQIMAYGIRGEHKGDFLIATTEGNKEQIAFGHSELIRAAYGQQTYSDNFVRLWTQYNQGTDQITASIAEAGEIFEGKDQLTWKKPLDNIYKTIEQLKKLGLKEGTPIKIYMLGWAKDIYTTV